MEPNNKKRSRKSKLVLRQVVELDEELQKILDISQDIEKPEENYLAGVDSNDSSYDGIIPKKEKDYVDIVFKEEKIDDYEEPSTSSKEVTQKEVAIEIPPQTSKIPQIMRLRLDNSEKHEPIKESSMIIDHTYSKVEESTNIQFSVNIEVEEFDDENITTDTLHIDEELDYGYRTNSEISVRKDLFIDPEKEVSELNLPSHVVNNIILGEGKFTSKIEALPQDIINSIILGDEFQSQHNTDDSQSSSLALPEKRENYAIITDLHKCLIEIFDILNQDSGLVHSVLRIEVLNDFWGNVSHFNTLHPIQKSLQVALDTWCVWYRITRFLPMYYKCYVCNVAYWHLNDLSDHLLSNHTEINVDIEVNDALCNIVAYDKTLAKTPAMKEIPVEGKCWNCCRNYTNHLKVTCEGCKMKFASCTVFIFHTLMCDQYKALKSKCEDQKITCDICLFNFYNQKDYEEHFVVKHSVRSDIPRSVLNRKCRVCKNTISFNHECTVKTPKKFQQCSHCRYRFKSVKALRDHIKYSETKTINCMLCEKTSSWRCQFALHMLTHTDAYKLYIKCMLCKVLTVFEDRHCFMSHMKKVHKPNGVDAVMGYGQKMILPTSLFDKYRLKSGTETINTSIGDTTTSNTSLAKIDESSTNVPENNFNSDNFTIKIELDEENQPVLTFNDPPIDKPVPAKNTSIKPKKPVKKPDRSLLKKSFKSKTKKNTKKMTPIKENIVQNEEDSTKDGATPYEELLSTIFGNFSGTNEMDEDAVVNEDNFDLVKVKTEIKEEPIDYDLFSESIDMNFMTEIKPEIIMGNVILKRTYCCTKCGFIGYHKEYKYHITTECSKRLNELTNIKYTCTKCNEEFPKLRLYIKHFIKHGYKALSCPQCFNVYDSPSKLGLHIQNHIKDLYLRLIFLTDDQMKQNFCYQCSKCKLRITENDFFEHWESHLQLNLSNEYTVEVNLCERENKVNTIENGDAMAAIDPAKMKIVLRQLQTGRRQYVRCTELKCLLCPKKFNRKMEIKRHLIEHLLMEAYSNKPRNGGLKCQICGEKYFRPDVYKQHMRSHAALPIYRCDICNKSFSDSSNFAKHKKVHNVKVLVCDYCEKKFQSKVTLMAHIELHLKNKVFRCPHCSNTYLSLAKRTKHIKKDHEGFKPMFRCMICRKNFISLKDKWEHLWVVHKERHIKADCPECGKKFRKPSDVKRHVAECHSHEIEITVD